MRFNPSPFSPPELDLGSYGLAASTTTITVSTLSQGARGGAVRYLHEALDSNNPRRRYATDAGATPELIDSHFGPKTKAAVKAFQKDNGLSQDGIVGPNTWAALATANTEFVLPPGQSSSGGGSTALTTLPPTTSANLPKEKFYKRKWFIPVLVGVVTLGGGLYFIYGKGR